MGQRTNGNFTSTLTSVLIVLFSVLLIIVIIQNTQIVRLRLLFWGFYISQVLLIFLTALISLTLGYLLGVLKRSRRDRAAQLTTEKGDKHGESKK